MAVNQDELRIDSDWLGRWQAERTPAANDHDKLVVADEIFPITLHINKQTGRISKLATLEYDLILGDVALEATYHDWRDFDGLFLSNAREALGGGHAVVAGHPHPGGG